MLSALTFLTLRREMSLYCVYKGNHFDFLEEKKEMPVSGPSPDHHPWLMMCSLSLLLPSMLPFHPSMPPPCITDRHTHYFSDSISLLRRGTKNIKKEARC